jgi:hypothetical protein
MQFHVQNTSCLLNERLSLSYGAKLLSVNADFTNNGNTPTAGIVAPIVTDATLLPQAGAAGLVSMPTARSCSHVSV